ncbi:hypothetical protein [Sinomicrobium weinanense]|uniref:Uncharacterized protein n=1 Tax=Sinomicrobium weinanense TaxID=2842200 RepID=A0A926JUT1_9FLAO|nr:hypothetical protein [Sinomicrobium weinanense]MBC9797699.1 hypothetical protein [Sinomicrobium weinanense]MBU3122275.1 hypothetical protein [Sinomicrobium weinanense]
MEHYQSIFTHLNQSLRSGNTDGFKALVNSISREVLFIDLSSSSLICGGQAYPYLELHRFLKPLSIRYVIVVQAHTPFPETSLLPPSWLRLSGWGHSLWQAYAELYALNEISPGRTSLPLELKVMSKTLQLCRLEDLRKAFRERNIVNIFGWVYNQEQKEVTDLNTDLLLTLDEISLYNNPEYMLS